MHLSIRIDPELESRLQRVAEILSERVEGVSATKTTAAKAALRRGLDAIISEEEARLKMRKAATGK